MKLDQHTNQDNQLILGILAQESTSLDKVIHMEYLTKQLSLPITFCKIDLNSVENDQQVDVLVVISSDTSIDNIKKIKCKYIFISGNLSSDAAEISSKLYNIADLSPSFVLLKLLIVGKYIGKFSAGLNKIDIATLIEISENRPLDFIEKCMGNDNVYHDVELFKNIARLYVAGKYIDFKDSFSLSSEGNTQLKFDLRRLHFLQIDKIKFYPHIAQCLVHDCSFRIEYSDGSIIELHDYITNASFLEENKFYFIDKEPLFEFKPLDKVNPDYIYCTFSLGRIEDTKYFRKPGTVLEIKDYYQYLVNSQVVGSFWNDNKNSDKPQKKDVYIILGPKYTGLDKLNEYLLDNASDLINNKVFYPTHQREFYNRVGRGGLYSMFSRKSDEITIFDENKASALKNDLKISQFKKLILASEDFLHHDRLKYCISTFENAKYIYYLSDDVDFTFEHYKTELYFNKMVIKFNEYIKNNRMQPNYIFLMLTYLSSENLILKNYSIESRGNRKSIVIDILSTIGYVISKWQTNSSEFDLFNISSAALEFKRLINYFSILDDNIVKFMQKSLIEYSTNVTNYVWLSEGDTIKLRNIAKEKLQIMYNLFNYEHGLEVLNLVTPMLNNFIPQEINREQILDIMSFLKEKDSEMYLRLIIELKLSKDVMTDSESFNLILAEI